MKGTKELQILALAGRYEDASHWLNKNVRNLNTYSRLSHAEVDYTPQRPTLK